MNIGDILKQKTLQYGAPSVCEGVPLTGPKNRTTERGELLKHFSEHLGMPIPRVARHLQGLELKDLYFIKSDCDRALKERNIPWRASFWHLLKPKSEN